MSNNALRYLIAGTLGATLALASPALAFHGGGGGGGMHGATAIPCGQSIGSHFLAIRPVLLEISQQVADLLLILEAGVDHLGAGNFGLGILDVLTKRRLVPGQTRVLVGIGIVISRIRTRLSANDAVQNGADRVLRGLADLMTGLAHGKDLFACRRILRQRGSCAGEDDEAGND